MDEITAARNASYLGSRLGTRALIPTTEDRHAELPLEFDSHAYRSAHDDLKGMNDDELQNHWMSFGIAEGRVGTPVSLRENFVRLFPKDGLVLEIGPFASPVMTGPNVRYFDVINTKGLHERAKVHGMDLSRIPETIHYVDSGGDLGVVDGSFTAVLSSHCIEHQPDLVAHLGQVARLLKSNGRYFLMIPDKRYCFDHFLKASDAQDVLAARGRKRHSFMSVFEHRALTTHNDSSRHWQGDHADPGFEDSIAERAQMARKEYLAAAGDYIDVHAWQFTPSSFRRVMSELHLDGHITLTVERVYQSPFGRNEFCAVLKLDGDRT